MPQITDEQLRQHNAFLATMHKDRLPSQHLWRELADNYLPQRYRWLLTPQEFTAQRARRQYIINNTGTQAARTLQAGVMNGLTSPSRPWLKLRIPGVSDQSGDFGAISVWLEQVERILLRIMAESNFYQSMAILYLDLGVFGSGANLIYPDREKVIHCYNPPLGEFYFATGDKQLVDRFARKFKIKVHQYIERWPDRRSWSDHVKNAVQSGGANLNNDVEISHFIAPNTGIAPRRFPYYELYWESKRNPNAANGTVLEKRGYDELPGMFSRWEVSGSDPYGVSPGMDALGDNIELQHLHREKAQLLEKSHKPPTLWDAILQNTPTATMPGGMTFVPNLNNTSGAKPIFTVNPNFAEINLDQQSIEERIRNAFFNFLFTGITNLQTTRSATEIDSREAEKLILLGGVVERLTSDLDNAVIRVYSLAQRAGLIPPPPPAIDNTEMEIQYISSLAIAQRAFGTAPTEQFLNLIGGASSLFPQARHVPKIEEMLINYGRDIGIRESELNTADEVREASSAEAQQEQQAELATQAPGLAQGAKALSETEVGGGGSVLDELIGG